jgi:hypothetical protein
MSTVRAASMDLTDTQAVSHIFCFSCYFKPHSAAATLQQSLSCRLPAIAAEVRLFRPIDFVELNRVREAFQVNLTVTFETKRLACTKFRNYSRRQDLTRFGTCADSRREIDR